VLITPMVDEAIAHIPAEQDYLIVTKKGTPYAKSGMTTAFADWREQAGLSRHGYSQHGLRKVLGGLMATAGATSKENAAVLGHDDLKHVELYSKSADDVAMSANAMNKVVRLVRGKAA
jgi:site-specific recombinase XerD